MTDRKALIAGSTGLVGKHLLQQLAKSGLYTEIISIVRRPTGIKLPNVKEEIINFENLENYEIFFNVNDIYICLGTTIKKAKTQTAFKKVDVEYPVKIATIAAKNNVQKLSVISAMGADSKSRIFYNRMKGIMEQEIIKTGIEAIYIYRPSLLLGKRSEFRFGERIASIFVRPMLFLFVGNLRKFRPIQAEKVAASMLKNCNKNMPGVNIYTNDFLFED